MSREAEKRELLKSLRECLHASDQLGLTMVGIFVSHAIDCLFAEELFDGMPPKNVD